MYAINTKSSHGLQPYLLRLGSRIMKLQGRRIFPIESGKTSLCFYIIYIKLTIQTTIADIGTNIEQKFDQVSTPTLPLDPLNNIM